MRFGSAIGRIVAAGTIFGCLACSASSLNPQKFEPLRAAAQSVQTEIHSADGSSSQLPELLRRLDAEIAATGRQVTGRQEKAALAAYTDAAEAYRYVLRFRSLDQEAVGGMLLLRGSNRPIALRYQVPFEERGGGRWVNRKTAMDTFARAADAAFARAIDVVRTIKGVWAHS
jgi:hypothetical protein